MISEVDTLVLMFPVLDAWKLTSADEVLQSVWARLSRLALNILHCVSNLSACSLRVKNEKIDISREHLPGGKAIFKLTDVA